MCMNNRMYDVETNQYTVQKIVTLCCITTSEFAEDETC
jgi:hypothetical protein